MKFRSAILLVILFTGIYSCKKAYDIPPAASKISYLNTINTTSDTLNYFLNGTRQNNTSTIFPLGSTGFLNVTTGQNNYEFRKNGSSIVLFSKVLALKDSVYQTVFVTGETADKAFLITDTAKASTTGTKIRFVNTADGGGLLTATVNDVAIGSNYPYKTIGGYNLTIAGTKTLKIYSGGSSVVSAAKTVALTTGINYTMYVKGVPGGIGAMALTIGLFGR